MVEKDKSETNNKRSRFHKKEKAKPPIKIIIRHLPPTMTEDEFLEQIDPLPEHDFYYYAAADWSLGYDATCRAYITFKNYDDVFLFRDRFDGYVFVDNKGSEYPAIVEFAPFQGLLKNKSRRSDNKVNTIEEESHYQQFLAKLEEERELASKGGDIKMEFSLDRKEEKITSTPLLQYLANKKEKRREEAKKRTEEKRKQREDEKEKRRQQQPVTKIMTNKREEKPQQQQQETKDSNRVEKKDGNGGATDSRGDGKSARSQRRAERNQRRREAMMQRKKELRDQSEKEDGKSSDTTATKRQDSTTSLDAPVVVKSEQFKQRRESKDSGGNNDRRERDRERNRIRREKEREKQREREKEKRKDAIIQKEKMSLLKKPSLTSSTSSSVGGSGGSGAGNKDDELTDSVRNFIRSVALTQDSKASAANDVAIKKDENKIVEKSATAVNVTSDKAVAEEPKKTEMTTKRATHDKPERTRKQRLTDEQRRIKNKDRPSIAIYQPKALLRMNSDQGSDHTTARNAGLPSTSDGENVNGRKEEPRSKKVSRYSERRSERHSSKDKAKSSDNDDNPTPSSSGERRHHHKIRKTKSFEDSSDVKEEQESEQQQSEHKDSSEEKQ